MERYEVAVCGAGIAGIATAYYLSIKHGVTRIVLIDKLQPMSLTTSKSGENFRDYWPQACMQAFSSHSLDLIDGLAEETRNAFDMKFFGYDFVSESPQREIFPSEDLSSSFSGLRRARGPEAIRRKYPYLAETIQQVVHIERAGAFDVHALGSLLLSRARDAGLEVAFGHVEAMERAPEGFRVHLRQGHNATEISACQLVLAAGPFVKDLAAMLEIELPVENYLQRKFILPDPDGVIPRDMPFTIFADAQTLSWDPDEAELLAADPEYRWLLDPFPAGLHIKPESGSHIKLGWAYNRSPETAQWQPPDDEEFPNIVLRGASRFVPGLRRYVDQIPTPVVQYAGYYTRTAENWPMIGPLEREGLFTVAALSGYGTMCACAAGELCADWMAGSSLPSYARNFHPDRYNDPAILAEIEGLESDGQL